MKTTKMRTMFLLLILTMTTLMSFSQMLYWAAPDNTLDMTTLMPSPIPGATGFSYTASNGAYDNSGTLLFYATSAQSGISIIDPSGTSILLDPILYSGAATIPLQEIAIDPVPQACKQYYVIWLGNSILAGVALDYAIVDCSSGVSIATNTTQIDSWGANSGGIAVTQSPSGMHYLLVAEKQKLVRYDITATGINNSLILADDISVPCFVFPGVETFELEVSPDGQKVLLTDWIATAGSSKVYELWFSPDVYNPAPSVTQATYNYPNTNTYGFGVEYNDDASRVFVAENNGLYWANTSTIGGTLTSITSSSSYNQCHLEYGLSDIIYAVDNSGNLGNIINEIVEFPLLVPLGLVPLS